MTVYWSAVTSGASIGPVSLKRKTRAMAGDVLSFRAVTTDTVRVDPLMNMYNCSTTLLTGGSWSTAGRNERVYYQNVEITTRWKIKLIKCYLVVYTVDCMHVERVSPWKKNTRRRGKAQRVNVLLNLRALPFVLLLSNSLSSPWMCMKIMLMLFSS